MTDAVILQTYVGPVTLSDGSHDSRVRQNNMGDLLVSKGLPDQYEQVLRGNAFVYSTPAAGAALVAPTTTNAPMIWNPSGSGKNLVIEKIALGYVGTTWAPGFVEYGVLTNAGSQIGTGAPVVSLTQVAGVNRLIGGGNATVMRFAPTTLVLIAAPTFLCPSGFSAVTGTAAAVLNPYTLVDNIDGGIIIPPGVAFFVMANAAIAGVVATAIYGLELPIAPTA